jgi:hypothetical protein
MCWWFAKGLGRESRELVSKSRPTAELLFWDFQRHERLYPRRLISRLFDKCLERGILDCTIIVTI